MEGIRRAAVAERSGKGCGGGAAVRARDGTAAAADPHRPPLRRVRVRLIELVPLNLDAARAVR